MLVAPLILNGTPNTARHMVLCAKNMQQMLNVKTVNVKTCNTQKDT